MLFQEDPAVPVSPNNAGRAVPLERFDVIVSLPGVVGG
jgi:hypothetical protein